MQPIVGHGGAEFNHHDSMRLEDLGTVSSIGSHSGINCPSRKQPHINGSCSVGGSLLEDKKPSINALLDECLFEIFRRIAGGRTRSAAACVCKRWLMILTSIRNSEFYKGKPCGGYRTRCVEGWEATDVKLAAIAASTSGRGQIGELSIIGNNSPKVVSNLGISAIARSCPSLGVLVLCNLPSVGDAGLFEIASECHSLEQLDLCQCPSVTDRGLAAIVESCPRLSALAIESCPNIGDEGLKAIANFCQRLRSISIKDCALVGDQGIASVMSSGSTILGWVKLESLNITSHSVSAIGQFGKAITDLALCGLPNVTQWGFCAMGITQGLQMLSSLTITSCDGMTDLSLEAVGSGFPNLKNICLCQCGSIFDIGLAAFSKAAGSLARLQLEECNGITLMGILCVLSCSSSKLESISLVSCLGIKDLFMWRPLLSPCESLRCLSIRSCPGFGNAGLAMLGMMCPQLERLDLIQLCGITDAGLLPVLESCEAGLEKVNLCSCSNLTDQVVLALARFHGKTLESLNLDGCQKITDVSLVAIAESCPFLCDLDLSKCLITDSGVRALSSWRRRVDLQVLSLSGCSMVTDKSITALKELLTIEELSLQNCNRISPQMIGSLKDALWSCKIRT